MKDKTRDFIDYNFDEKEKVRLSLDLTQEMNNKVENLMSHYGSTKSDVLRKAINLLDIARKAQEEGKEIGIAEKGKEITSIILI